MSEKLFTIKDNNNNDYKLTVAYNSFTIEFIVQHPTYIKEKYESATTKFKYLYTDVAEKRAAAQAAIDEAKKRVAESEKFAEEADIKAPITEQVEGIEDEDAVLLEADDYEDPEDAEVEIAEEIEDEYVEVEEE